MNVIATQNLSKHFSGGKVRALDGVSLQVGAGLVFGLLGPNGAGKTTLVKVLLSILHPTSGTAAIFGKPVSDYNQRRRIGYLPENHRYPDFFKGSAVMDYFGRFAGVPKALRRQRIPELLKLVGMDKWANTKIRKYSKGMMQRHGLAVAMINDPDLLILDEPTDGVDPIGRKEIRDIILKLKQQGKTIFINSHLLSEVEMVCDEVAIMNKGKIIVQGAIEQLTNIGLSYRIQTSPLAEAIKEKLLAAFGRLSLQNSHIEVRVKDHAELNRLIDHLRQNQAEIHAIVPQRRTLEESFFAAIQGAASGDFNELAKSSESS
ncbi:MAG: ABC transporter ATP-binding protein [candidate division KSB1 bacterium]|nr:ABC transporter ATP-binding protein [candidate division KSB1 bacterium]MDZ7301893.1 ABC transporter ATP-binding protein [candidate division KSB1 bacterium]MDZ7310276.1 ABC transporter ATP-binding protein [candidate division KSB1 bacterium]